MSAIFRAFVEHETSIRRIIGRYFRRAEDIEDLTHETFLRSFAVEMTVEIAEPKAFLFRVAKNLALSEVKKKARTKTDSIEDSGGPEVLKDEGAATAEEEIDGKRKLVALSMAIADLPIEYRQVFLMRKVEKLRHKQIATQLKISVSSVEKRVAMAILLCNDYLRKNGFDPAEFGMPAQRSKQPSPHAVVPIRSAHKCTENTLVPSIKNE